jgi:hypothetical protein
MRADPEAEGYGAYTLAMFCPMKYTRSCVLILVGNPRGVAANAALRPGGPGSCGFTEGQKHASDPYAYLRVDDPTISKIRRTTIRSGSTT